MKNKIKRRNVETIVRFVLLYSLNPVSLRYK
jgi:hypothetical protein